MCARALAREYEHEREIIGLVTFNTAAAAPCQPTCAVLLRCRHYSLLRTSRAVCSRAEYTLECVGGGRIEHVPSAGRIFVYGYSMGFGRANHEIAVALLKEAYPTYSDISYSNDGY